VALCLAVGLLLVSIGVVVAQGEAGEPAGRGFVLFGISMLYDGSEKLRSGVVQLLEGNEQLVEGLDA